MNRFLSFKAVLILLSFFMLTACGGGGGDSKPKPEPAPVVETDTDGDGIPDSSDTDDDNDGVADSDDAFPLDGSESIDTDGDGIGNNADEDDDGDGVADSDDAFPLDAAESVDTDSDGIGNNADDDDDNDGVADTDDAFPLDASESVDTDGDGIGNNADEDDDGDGVNDDEDDFPLDPAETADNDSDGVGNNADFYPENSVCFAESDGNGQDCYFTLLKSDNQQLQKVVQLNNSTLFYSPTLNKILRFDAMSDHFNFDFDITNEGEIADIAYSSETETIYYSVEDSLDIFKVSAQGEEETFATVSYSANRLITRGEKLLVHSQSRLYQLDSEGNELNSLYFSGDIEHYHWNDDQSELYLSIKAYSSAELYKVSFLIQEHDNSEYLDGERAREVTENTSPLIPLPNDLLLANRVIYSTDFFKQISGPSDFFDAFTWSDDNQLLTLKYSAGNTELSVWDESLRLIDQKVFLGAPVTINENNDGFSIITNQLDSLVVNTYQLLDDSDNDGVVNSADDFPIDIAASVDSDKDGYPDRWNENYTETDSTTNLTLDAFSQQSVCWLVSHADSEGNCDFIATMEQHVPQQTLASEQHLYLYSSENQAIYPWAADTQTYLKPITVGKTLFNTQLKPSSVALSVNHQRLYVGYTDGDISYVDLTTDELQEVSGFYQFDSLVGKIADAGNYIYVRGVEYDYSLQSKIVDINGNVTFEENYSHFDHSAWDPTNDRLHLLDDSSYLLTRSINQTNGEITQDNNGSPYLYGDFVGPIKFSEDQSEMLLANGYKFDTETLESIAHYNNVDEALWIENGNLVLLSEENNTISLVRLSETDQRLEELTLTGNIVGFVSLHEKSVILLERDGRIIFHDFIPNDDTDGDSVANIDDAFPNDPAASVDSDNDGYPDEWNAGYSAEDSTTGLTLDAFTSDAACWLDSHDDGNGRCDYQLTIPGYRPDITFGDEQGMVYLFSQENSKVFRWNSATENYVNPIPLGIEDGFASASPIHAAYVASHNRIYFGYESGTLTFVDLTSAQPSEQEFAHVDGEVQAIIEVDEFVFVAQPGSYHLISQQGQITDTTYGPFSRHFEWNHVLKRLYFFRDFTSPNDIHAQSIDLTNGTFGDRIDSPYHGDYSITGPIRISNDGEQVFIGSGNVFNAVDLTWEGSVGRFDDARWLQSDEFVLFEQNRDAQPTHYQIIRKDPANRILEQQVKNGELISTVLMNESIVIISEVDTALSFDIYLPNNDSDGDLVENVDDAFPLDAAASLDADRDGYPDAWNDGSTAEDSTTGLAIDAFPNDSACWLESHDDGSGQCDYGATMPNFTPEEIVTDSNGNIYLYSEEHAKVYRWSAATESYLNPISVGQNSGFTITSPQLITYSNEHQRIYLGYQSGLITFVSTEDGSQPDEVEFARIAQEVEGLTSVGNFVLAQDSSGAWYTHYIFNEAGTLTDSDDWNRYSRYYDWNPSNNRVYFFRDRTSPNDLHYEQIDQTTGEITADAETPYHGDYRIQGPIKVSDDGEKVLIGSGEMFSADSLSWVGSVESFADMQWLDDGQLALLNQDEQQIELKRIDLELNLYETQMFNGQLLKFVNTGEHDVIISLVDDEFVFTRYEADDDLDDDGVNNIDDAFPTDPAASVDNDRDGYPDQWNDGYSEADSTTNLELDAFNNDSACWSDDHAADNGLCNYSATFPEFTPDQILMDENGVVFLYSSEFNKVYRWNSSTEEYLNPIVLGNASGITESSVAKMAYSAEHDRLYFGYDSGLVTYINLDNADLGAYEQSFYRTAEAVGGLASVGNYVLATDASGAGHTHYIINRDGEQTDKKDWNRFSNYYTWDPIASRVYFFRDSTSPNDLEYEDIDQATGKITASGDSPYHGDYQIAGPIFIAGNYIMLGSGNQYHTSNLNVIGSLDHEAPFISSIHNNFITAREVNENWQLDLYEMGELTHLYTQPLADTVIGLFRNQTKTVVIGQQGEEISFNIYRFGDNDGDLMPAWWEQTYGLSDSDPSDAELDNDGDQLTNVQEYIANTNPLLVDTDGDELSDHDEINTHNSNPLRVDSDNDGLSDGDEVLVYGTEILNQDTDNDGFKDGDEVHKYGTDPLDIDSAPVALDSFIDSFEEDGLSAFWVLATSSNAGWLHDDNYSSDGAKSLRSGDIGHNEHSSVKFEGLLESGTFSFDAFVSSESCCDRLKVILNGTEVLDIRNTNNNWEAQTVNIEFGENIIEFRYQKDGSASNGEDAAFIDNVSFSSN
ncbi:hypothetical protein SOPP22_00160 [Shewanella sp. OPT22]|nr:hypothetical protein SOPP22_00160 [Shewanella sp. OPT22]